MFEEHLLGGLFVHFNVFFQIFSCRTHHNFSRKQNFVAEHILPGHLKIRKISQNFTEHIFICQTDWNFVNYMKNSSCRIPPKLPGAKHRENTCFSLCTARWLLSIIFQSEPPPLIKKVTYNSLKVLALILSLIHI